MAENIVFDQNKYIGLNENKLTSKTQFKKIQKNSNLEIIRILQWIPTHNN